MALLVNYILANMSNSHNPVSFAPFLYFALGRNLNICLSTLASEQPSMAGDCYTVGQIDLCTNTSSLISSEYPLMLGNLPVTLSDLHSN